MASIILNVPEDLLAGLRAKAAASGKSVEALAEEALRASLDLPSWEDLLAYGQERGRLFNLSEEQAP
jgi:plasmid stability protein